MTQLKKKSSSVDVLQARGIEYLIVHETASAFDTGKENVSLNMRSNYNCRSEGTYLQPKSFALDRVEAS